MQTSRAPLPPRWLALPLLVVVLIGPGAPLAGQVFHRDRCSRPDCPADVFRLEVERMTLTEGPMASDRDETDLRELRGRILSELEAAPNDPWLWLALSEAEFGLGDPLPAMTAATRALEAGADSSLALRARAAGRMRMAGGEFEGATLYLEALTLMTPESRERFMADVMPLLTQFELDWWRSADLEILRSWIRDYWQHRAAIAGVRLEDRLVEHMRRTATASRLFAPPGTGSGATGNADVLRSPDLRMLPYDDRGLVYVRRGPPLEEMRAAVDVFSDAPSITWLYGSVDGGSDAFHFARGDLGGSGFRLVTAPACDPAYAGGPSGTLSTVGDGWVLSETSASSDPRESAASCFGGDRWARAANYRLNSIMLRRETMRALAMESPREPFHRALPAYFDHFMFRGEGNTTEVFTPVVIPVENGVAQPVDVLVTFADRGGGVVRRVATSSSTHAEVQQSIVSEGEGWGVAYARTVVQAADSVTYRVVVRDPSDPDRGGMWGGSTRVRSFTNYGLKMSDVVVSGSGPGMWSRGATRLFLLPGRSFLPSTPAAIFYELYDAEPGAAYRTELTLEAADESLGERLWHALTGSREVRIRFDSRAPDDAGPTIQELRSLVLPAEEGRYTLTIRVTDENGRTAESRRDVVIARNAAAPSGNPVAPPATDPTE